MSFIISKEVEGQKLYWQYGAKAGWSEFRIAARQYAQVAAANQAKARILKRPDGQGAKVESTNG